jgi:hypothetical protein
MTDPVQQDMDDDDERQAAQLADIDKDLDDHQRRLDRLMHVDPVGYVWFGDNDAWLDKRLGDAQ